MSFFADKQTLDDLNIPGRHKNNSISRLFDTVVTAGGKKVMDAMFQKPLTDAEEINKRSTLFSYFTKNFVAFPFTADEFEVMENYLGSAGGSILEVGINTLSKRFLQITAQGTSYEMLNTEVCKTIELLNRFYDFANRQYDEQSPYVGELTIVKNIFGSQKLSWLRTESEAKKLKIAKLIRYDYLLRTALYAEMQQLTAMIFRLDVYLAVAKVAAAKGFSYARAYPRTGNLLTITGLYHPAVPNAVGNALSLSEANNVLFLTGANMAGKSTLMKAFGISIYLAHMGFPVAASHMEFSVKDGLYSSINVPDNLGLGYSHFYAEVLRVKTVAEQVAADKDLVVIFDELFKGTNVKDAYDATLSITEAFSENRNCFFVISTHIVEVGESLRERCSN
ncbi:DNA mismatch repair protein, partial [Mucilaginibacter sp.]|uniref:MutS-related protein n=1 Tax=Mucilaginibacter sp. TaxID=1882438 RepID=UPI0035BBE4AB